MTRYVFTCVPLLLWANMLVAQEACVEFANFSGVEAAFASQQVHIQQQQEQIQQLELRLASFEKEGKDVSKGGKDACGYADWCSPDSGLNFMTEVVWLRAGDSDADSPDIGYQSGSRYQLGYMTNRGREFRMRYFEYRNLDVTGNGIFDMHTWDFEYAGRFNLGCNWRGELAGGVRLASLSEQFGLTFDDAWGPVVSAKVLSKPWRNLSPYGQLRESYVVGKDVLQYGGFGVTELQVGVEWNRSARFGDMFARGMIEGQHIDAPFEGGNESVTLVGFGFALGFTR